MVCQFAVQHGPTPLCTWDLPTGIATFTAHAMRQDGRLVMRELDKCGFVLRPSEDGQEYRILIGDIPVADLMPDPAHAGGAAMLGQLVWPDISYFESGRGDTKVILESREEVSDLEAWKPLLQFSVYVVPSKISEESYQRMVDDLSDLSRSLVVDLYGKSNRTCDVRLAKQARSYHSREEELDSIVTVVDRLGVLLHGIQQSPASRAHREVVRANYWGSERLGPRAVAVLSCQGISAKSTIRPIPVVQTRLVESFDVVEHRTLKAFLNILKRRAGFCASAAGDHIRAISAERPLRNIRFDEGPTLYESVDIPKIRRLTDAICKANRAARLIEAMGMLPFLADVRPELAHEREGAFQRNAEYREVLRIIRGFLHANALWSEGEDFSAVTKLTSRLFEQWCFLRIVEAFRASGLDLREWSEAFRPNLHSRFILDFDRGLHFEGRLSTGLRLRLRYEPWILGEQSAERVGETLYRASSENVAWCPDIVVECLKQQDNLWQPVYAIVLDCKYAMRIRDQHWSDTHKYLQIRSTRSKRQVVRQLWLISPDAGDAITCTDPAVAFGRSGPSCARTETVCFSMKVKPRPSEVAGTESPTKVSVFAEFASGTVNYLRRELI